MPDRKQKTTLPPDVMEAYLELSKDCIAIYSLEGVLEYCNPANLEVFGYGPEDLFGTNIKEIPFLNPDQVDQVETLFNLLKEKGEIEPVEFEVTRKDGNRIWVEANATLLLRKGKPFAIQTVTRDISSRKDLEVQNIAQREFEQRVSGISSLFINMPDGEIDRGIQSTLEEIGNFIGAKRAGLFIMSDDHIMTSFHQWSADADYSGQGLDRDIPVEKFGYAAKVMGLLNDYVVGRRLDIPEEASGERQWYKKYGFHPIFAVPIISENKFVGSLGFVGEREKEIFWPRHYSILLRYIANILFNAIKRKEISGKLRLAQITLERYSDGIFWFDKDYKLIDVNSSACNSLGYTREELLTMNVTDFDPNFTRKELKELWEKLRVKGSMTFESSHRKQNGEIFPIDVTANYIEFEGEEFQVAYTHDITNRKLAEDVFRRSENEFRKIFENVVDVFYEASLDGKMVNVTPSVERLTKYAREELIGEPMERFYYDPSVRDPLLKELQEKGFVANFELDIRDKDGEPIPAILSSRLLLDDEGRPSSIVGAISDMTDRKKAEIKIRQLSTALEQSPTPIIITDPESKILFVNNSFTSFSNMNPDEVIGNTPDIITRGQIRMSGNSKMWKTIQSGKIFRDEMQYTLRDKGKVWLSATVSPVLDELKKVTHYVVIFEDITERKAYENSLKNAKEKAEESDRLKSAFLANMSHEIRTPMNAILGFSSLLKEQHVDPDQQAYYIDIINSKGKDLLRIISDIIDISRIEAGDLYIRTEPISVFSFIREIYEELRMDAQLRTRKNLQFRLNIPAVAKAVIVNSDSSRLKQIFVNLIQNAIKFTPDGYIEMGFELLEGNNIRMFVKDTGIGIPKEKQDIIFDRFRQVDDSHTRQYGGTGLGLAICLSLVEKMGGQLKVKSGEGQGSEFHFTLKYILTQAPEPKEKVKETGVLEAKLDLTGKKILIVEDDGTSYLFLETLLKKYNPEVSWVKNGKLAISQIQKSCNFDMILMDIRMPEMNGLEATREIRKTHPDIPIVAQTAYAQITDRKEALDSGCNEYISKPISPVELKSILLKYFKS